MSLLPKLRKDGAAAQQPASYDTDVVAWAAEQALLIRAGRFDRVDLEHIADEIEDVGKSEQRELASRMAVLLTHLLKWQFQPERRGSSWRSTISLQRKRIVLALKAAPSLKAMLAAPDWQADMWLAGLEGAVAETGLDEAALPDACPWSILEEVLLDGWFPP